MRVTIGGRSVALYPAGRTGAPLVLVNGHRGEGEAILGELRAMSKADFSLACVETLNWGEELTPWPHPAVMPGGAPFAGGAEEYLAALTGGILPAVVDALDAKPAWTGIAGYSLAGLFALYALCRSDVFARAASVSGSLWYPGFLEYANAHPPLRPPSRVYLSVGDREARVRSEAMRTVEENTRVMARRYRQPGTEVAFELNRGGHFDRYAWRMAKGIAWLLEE